MMFEIVVATAAPVTSCPFGRITNINSGSSRTFRMPPILRPMLAWPEYPTFRSRCASAIESTLGRQPNTTTMDA